MRPVFFTGVSSADHISLPMPSRSPSQELHIETYGYCQSLSFVREASFSELCSRLELKERLCGPMEQPGLSNNPRNCCEEDGGSAEKRLLTKELITGWSLHFI